MKDDLPVTVMKSLRDCGKDEYWLQDKIYEDPSVLGLGDLERVSNEKVQSSGGRLDMLLKDPEDDSMFEVEVMLGEADESHIIRTVEYWDLEKRRWGKRSHTAVLIAQGINTRFINVVHLLSQAIPIVGIQVSAVELDGKLGLHFTEMINSYEEPEVEGDSPLVDEDYWKKERPDTLIFAKGYEALARTLLEDVALRSRRDGLVLTIGELIRIWIWPAKGAAIWVEYRMEAKEVDTLKQALEAKGIFPKISHKTRYTYLKFKTEKDSLTKYAEEHKKLLLGLDVKHLKTNG
jgi:hypothetical protein